MGAGTKRPGPMAAAIICAPECAPEQSSRQRLGNLCDCIIAAGVRPSYVRYCRPAQRSRTLVRTSELAVQNEPRLIAIVDDDDSVREGTKSLIRSMGLAAEAFSSGEDFLRSSQLGGTACLVADVNMPGMSGLDLHRRVATVGKGIPTILITAYPNDSVRARALSAGIICYLIKPFSEEELLRCIRFALDEEDGASAP